MHKILKKMSTKEKLVERFKTLPKDFTFDEMKSLLGYFGFVKYNKGKTSGSRVVFHKDNEAPIMLHKPHPENVLKKYAMKQVMQQLKDMGYI